MLRNATALAACMAISAPALAATLTEDFEAGGVPVGWSIIGADASNTFSNLANGNPGQAGNFDNTGSNSLPPSVYMVNNGFAFDATQAITGSFDFYLVEDGNYSYSNMIIGDISTDASAGAAGKFINVDMRERTFGRRASIYNAAGVKEFDGDGNNQYRIDTNTWINASFTWTPTAGTTGDFVFEWTYPAQPNRGPMTASGYTFDSAMAYIGFGTGDSPIRYDNIRIEGTEFVDPNAIPSPTAALAGLIGMGALVGRRRRRA